MNVYITCTPEFPEEQLTKIVTLLKSTPGELVFYKGILWNIDRFSAVDRRFYDLNGISCFSFSDYFHLTRSYRIFNDKIKDDEFVILISSIQHDDEWFSAFDGRNIFVHAGDWEHISDADPIFGIAYQCLENILQSLMGLNIHDYKNEPNIHEKSIGCINDYCDDKKEILNKLRTADICESCLERASKGGLEPKILVQIGGIIEKIRHAFISKRKFDGTPKLKMVEIDASATIKIGDNIFEPVGEIPKLLFIYFLKHPEGLESKTLCKKNDEFFRIYKLIKQKDGITELDQNTINTFKITIENLCCKTGKDKNSIFRVNKARLNSDLKILLGNELAKHYQVNSINLGEKNYLFKISLNHDYFNIDPRF